MSSSYGAIAVLSFFDILQLHIDYIKDIISDSDFDVGAFNGKHSKQRAI